ncbi:MAG: oligopeptide transporter, OPT family [Acetatifactor sp.]|nr:oligopeptide transporter, OPT family [Acetatifactor sp.]
MTNEEFKPYIPADKITPEFTVTSVIMGVLLAIIFGAANAYLGLRVGMTVSASIPAAVISMAVIRVIMKKDSILESNMVQTIGSAGESLAAGAIFTMPALFLWAKEGVMEAPNLLEITVIALCGGLLGVLFMVPLRNALIVKEHGVLPYPEGTACAEVLLAGEEGGASAKSVFAGMGIAAVFKFLVDGLGVVGGVITAPIKALKTELSAEVYPALVGVGYICGPKIAGYMFAGGVLGWFVLIPAIAMFGGDTVLYPASVSVAELFADGGAAAIWSKYIRYIGAGAVAAGGIISLVKTFPLIIRTFADAMKGLKGSKPSDGARTSQDLSMKFIGIGVIVMILVLWALPQIPVSLVGAIFIIVFGFFFATVSSRMVGLVGSSNNPVSGMAIATLLIATALLKVTGDNGAHGMQGAIAIGSIICIIAAMAGDTSQDLKTGYILGATPKKQQIGEIVGTIVAALVIGGVLVLLDNAWGFGTEELAAPQATLMKMIVEGVMDGNLPWALVFTGAFIAIAVEIIGVSSLPVAIGLYLPLELSSTILLGGLIRLAYDKRMAKKAEKEDNEAGSGILFCSGMIAGEGLVGIILAIVAALGGSAALNISDKFTTGTVGGVIVLILMMVAVWFYANKKDSKQSK